MYGVFLFFLFSYERFPYTDYEIKIVLGIYYTIKMQNEQSLISFIPIFQINAFAAFENGHINKDTKNSIKQWIVTNLSFF